MQTQQEIKNRFSQQKQHTLYHYIMFKKHYWLALSALLFIGCSFTKKPEFKRIDAIRIDQMNLQNVTLEADAVFENPNSIGGRLSVDNIHVFVNEIDMGTVSSNTFEVPAKKEFTIPIRGTFSLSKLYSDNKKGILGNILNTLQTQNLDIKYEGKITYYLGNFSHSYNIDKSEKISINR